MSEAQPTPDQSTTGTCDLCHHDDRTIVLRAVEVLEPHHGYTSWWVCQDCEADTDGLDDVRLLSPSANIQSRPETAGQ